VRDSIDRAIVPYLGSVVLVASLVTGLVLLHFNAVLPESLGPTLNIAVLTLYFALAQLSMILTGFMIARQSFGPLNVISLLAGFTGVLALGFISLLGPSLAALSAVIAVIIGIEALRLGTMAAYAVRSGWLSREGHRKSPPPESGMARYSLLTTGTDILQFLNYRVDVWILGVLGSMSSLGVYALSVSMAELVWIVPAAAGRVLFPKAAADAAEARQLTSKVALMCFVIAGALGLAGWAVSRVLVVPLFGSGFADVPMIIGILLLGIVPFSVAKILGTHFAGTNALHRNIAASSLTLPVALLLNFLLVPPMGAYGAAIATAVAYTLQTVVLIAFWRLAEGRRGGALVDRTVDL
jgi:O-antigen/teichoic acid export membrane protein